MLPVLQMLIRNAREYEKSPHLEPVDNLCKGRIYPEEFLHSGARTLDAGSVVITEAELLEVVLDINGGGSIFDPVGEKIDLFLGKGDPLDLRPV